MNTHPKPADLPAVLAVLDVRDYGPCDNGEGSATCPHCGAQGRYVISFLCDDGTKRGAMQGCFQLFRGSNTRTAKLVQEAFKRKTAAALARKPLAKWWTEIVDEAQDFGTNGSIDEFPIFASRILAIDDRRQSWLKKNGYGRFGMRGGSFERRAS